ncbi:hypothetical protein D3C83_29730 [compost metagenome]
MEQDRQDAAFGDQRLREHDRVHHGQAGLGRKIPRHRQSELGQAGKERRIGDALDLRDPYHRQQVGPQVAAQAGDFLRGQHARDGAVLLPEIQQPALRPVRQLDLQERLPAFNHEPVLENKNGRRRAPVTQKTRNYI